MAITIGIVDDMQLFTKSLATLINKFENFNVSIAVLSGEDLLKNLELNNVPPDIMLLDVQLAKDKMSGPDVANALSKKYPSVKLVALSMNDDKASIISMIKAGCCSYLLKDIHDSELQKALNSIYIEGHYYADAININNRQLIIYQQKNDNLKLTEKELEFLKFACTDLTYQQIADEMGNAERTIDGYRASLFMKFDVKSRVGMVMEALKRRIISISEYAQ